MPSRFVQELSRRVLVCDGAMGTSIHKHDLSVEKDYCGCENCTDKTCKCGRPALYRASGQGFCRAHYAEAIKATAQVKSQAQSQHGLTRWNHVGDKERRA